MFNGTHTQGRICHMLSGDQAAPSSRTSQNIIIVLWIYQIWSTQYQLFWSLWGCHVGHFMQRVNPLDPPGNKALHLTQIGARSQSQFCFHIYQRVSIASYANCWYSQRRIVRLSVCPSVCPSHSGIVSKRRKLASWLLHHPRAWTF